DKITNDARGESSDSIRVRVEEARRRQQERLSEVGMACNADMGPGELRKYCPLKPDSQALIRAAMSQMQLSARGYHRILKVSRTIADLEGAPDIKTHHLAEALQYRTRVLTL
ncbi:MAG: magnesium chelatase, partial [Anaerolineae bacterium]|nr:magnesium chelatase [Anaerolineae bacterium]